MTQSWEIICQGIQAGLFGREIDIPENANWPEIFEESKKQAITGCVYPGIQPYLPEDLRQQWKGYNLRMITYAAQLIHTEEELCRLLTGIPFCILKGTAAAVYYPQPMLRTMGDIDFIVPQARFGEAKEILLRAGYIPEEEAGYDRHIHLHRGNILLEMHRYFSHDSMNVDPYIDRCYTHLAEGRIQNLTFPMLPPLENGIILLAHLRQHLYSGVGMRQILDWVMFVAKELDDTRWEPFRREARKLGMEKLAVAAARLGQKYLGLNPEIRWCREGEEALCDRLMANVIRTGNFGRNQGRGNLIEKTVINLRKAGWLRYLQTAGEFNWKALKKHPWLKPFAPVYQVGRYIRQGRETRRDRKTIREDFQRSTERFDLLKDLGL